MSFFYGGAFSNGGGSFPLYDGVTDISLVNDVILVTSNYRLNSFGFLSGDELRAESGDGSVGTYGYLDQVRLLTFLRDNVASFGGDPSRVTIFGESAGGASVCHHLTQPLSRGLFHGAIIESGAW
jgi:para-nitrobenzyl esterase